MEMGSTMNNETDFYLLIKHGDLPNIKSAFEGNYQDLCKVTIHGENLLLLSVLEKQLEILRFLIQLGCDLNQGNDERGLTPLQAAALVNSLDAAEALIAANAQIDVRDKYGNTPLLDAVYAFRDDLSMITLLLESGANPFQKNDYGISPYSLARETEKNKVLKVINNIYHR